MKNQDDPRQDLPSPEVETRKRHRFRSIAPIHVNDLEDPRGHAEMLDRLFAEIPPSNILEEGDLVSAGQLRWSTERLHNLAECELNQQIRLPLLSRASDSRNRLMLGHRLCAIEKHYLVLHKHRFDHLKMLNTLSARVEKWSAPKPVRARREKEI
ncbi:MAG: hypothetical protein ACK5TN_12835 [Acidobacteriota bacterium]|jgi:hypothetical protein